MNNLTADTTLALLQSAQADSSKAAQKLQSAKELEKVEEAAKEFEAVFVAEMMKPMFEGLSTEAPFGGGKGEEVFRSLLVQEYGKMISQTGSVGIADHVKAEMIRMQETIDDANITTSE